MTAPIHVREVLAEPERFEGQPVSVFGIYMRIHENQCLDDRSPFTDKDFALIEDPAVLDQGFRLWLETDERTSWSHVSRQHGDYCPVIVHGVYSHGTCGHCGRYPGQIVSIKSIEAAECPKRPLIGEWMGSFYGGGGRRSDLFLSLQGDGSYSWSVERMGEMDVDERGQWTIDEYERTLHLNPNGNSKALSWAIYDLAGLWQQPDNLLILRPIRLGARNLPVMFYRVHLSPRD